MSNDQTPMTNAAATYALRFGGFVGEVCRRADALDRECEPFIDARSALDELQRRLTRIRAAINEDDHLEQHRQLVTLLAHGCRMARDLSIDSEAAAVLLDDAELDRK